jgi:succinate dehydrogenase flavin-adding protein (antitoxin of CptAB toxin-antitoxin module)
MRELDYLLLPFYEKYIDTLSEGSLEILSEILNLTDPDLHQLLVSDIGQVPEKFRPIISKIKYSN